MDTTTEQDRLYVETTGTTCYLAGQRGTVTGLHTHPAHGVLGAFVQLEGPTDAAGTYLAPGPVLYVELGAAEGDRGQWREATSWRVLDRDGFDQLTGLDTLRTELGWR